MLCLLCHKGWYHWLEVVRCTHLDNWKKIFCLTSNDCKYSSQWYWEWLKRADWRIYIQRERGSESLYQCYNTVVAHRSLKLKMCIPTCTCGITWWCCWKQWRPGSTYTGVNFRILNRNRNWLCFLWNKHEILNNFQMKHSLITRNVLQLHEFIG